jgi:hypothetical protein
MRFQDLWITAWEGKLLIHFIRVARHYDSTRVGDHAKPEWKERKKERMKKGRTKERKDEERKDERKEG